MSERESQDQREWVAELEAELSDARKRKTTAEENKWERMTAYQDGQVTALEFALGVVRRRSATDVVSDRRQGGSDA